MTTTSQTIMRQQARLKGIQAAEVGAQPKRQDGDADMQERTVRSLNHVRDVLMKDAALLDRFYSGEFVGELV
jgi:hypothetical protein